MSSVRRSSCGFWQAATSIYCARCGSALAGLGTGQLPAHFALQQGRYLIVRAVGRGGMAAVYQAADQNERRWQPADPADRQPDG